MANALTSTAKDLGFVPPISSADPNGHGKVTGAAKAEAGDHDDDDDDEGDDDDEPQADGGAAPNGGTPRSVATFCDARLIAQYRQEEECDLCYVFWLG